MELAWASILRASFSSCESWPCGWSCNWMWGSQKFGNRKRFPNTQWLESSWKWSMWWVQSGALIHAALFGFTVASVCVHFVLCALGPTQHWWTLPEAARLGFETLSVVNCRVVTVYRTRSVLKDTQCFDYRKQRPPAFLLSFLSMDVSNEVMFVLLCHLNC